MKKIIKNKIKSQINILQIDNDNIIIKRNNIDLKFDFLKTEFKIFSDITENLKITIKKLECDKKKLENEIIDIDKKVIQKTSDFVAINLKYEDYLLVNENIKIEIMSLKENNGQLNEKNQNLKTLNNDINKKIINLQFEMNNYEIIIDKKEKQLLCLNNEISSIEIVKEKRKNEIVFFGENIERENLKFKNMEILFFETNNTRRQEKVFMYSICICRHVNIHMYVHLYVFNIMYIY